MPRTEKLMGIWRAAFRTVRCFTVMNDNNQTKERKSNMNIGPLDLEHSWRALAVGPAFNRKYKDANMDIEYGIEVEAGNPCRFCVKGTENGKPVNLNDFLEENDEGAFPKQYNRLRKLRPGGQDRKPGRQDDLLAGAGNCGFFCSDPTNPLSLLVRPLLGTLTPADLPGLHFSWNIYPNLAPFEPGGHILILPSASFPDLPHFPQLLTQFLLEDLFNLWRASSKLMIFFNSRHAGASQDHFHIQCVLDEKEFPITRAEESCNSGLKIIGSNYPINAVVYSETDERTCWHHVMNLQTKGIPFNLIFLRKRGFLVPRDINNEITIEFPTPLAAMEVAGKFIIPDRQQFVKATDNRLSTALHKVGLSLDDIISLLGK